MGRRFSGFTVSDLFELPLLVADDDERPAFAVPKNEKAFLVGDVSLRGCSEEVWALTLKWSLSRWSLISSDGTFVSKFKGLVSTIYGHSTTLLPLLCYSCASEIHYLVYYTALIIEFLNLDAKRAQYPMRYESIEDVKPRRSFLALNL